MSAALAYTDASTTARALHVLDRTQLAAWRTTQSVTVNAWIDAQGFAIHLAGRDAGHDPALGRSAQRRQPAVTRH